MKRDDLLSFGLGGNKVRKMQTVAAEALAAGADTLITCGGVQSNHARVTAAAGAALGLRGRCSCSNGTAPRRADRQRAARSICSAPTVRYVAIARRARADDGGRSPTSCARDGRRPFVVPLGASTPTGALGFARGVAEIAAAGLRPTSSCTASSSGGTQAGLIAGCALFGLRRASSASAPTNPAAALARHRRASCSTAMARAARREARHARRDRGVEVDDAFVGDGYGVPTPASTEALELVARREGIVLDPVYTAKAMAGLIARVRARRVQPGRRPSCSGTPADCRAASLRRIQRLPNSPMTQSPNDMTLTCLGAARTVTGSKHLLDAGGHRVLVDCGLFQGLKELRERNWQALPVRADSIDAVVLTHAHLDHCGYLPRLVGAGLQGPHLLHAGDGRARADRARRRREAAGRRRRARQSQGLHEALAGAAALHRRRTRRAR